LDPGGGLGKNNPKSLKIQVTDLEKNTSTLYNSMNDAAKALNCFQSAISANLRSKSQKPYLGRYIFKLN